MQCILLWKIIVLCANLQQNTTQIANQKMALDTIT